MGWDIKRFVYKYCVFKGLFGCTISFKMCVNGTGYKMKSKNVLVVIVCKIYLMVAHCDSVFAQYI